MSSAAKKLNGKKPANPVGCGHPDCEMSKLLERLVEDTQRQLAEQAQALATALGAIDSRLGSIEDRLNASAEHLALMGEQVVVTGQRERLNGRLLTAVMRHLSQTGPPKAQAKLQLELVSIQEQAQRELGGADA